MLKLKIWFLFIPFVYSHPGTPNSTFSLARELEVSSDSATDETAPPSSTPFRKRKALDEWESLSKRQRGLTEEDNVPRSWQASPLGEAEEHHLVSENSFLGLGTGLSIATPNPDQIDQLLEDFPESAKDKKIEKLKKKVECLKSQSKSAYSQAKLFRNLLIKCVRENNLNVEVPPLVRNKTVDWKNVLLLWSWNKFKTDKVTFVFSSIKRA